MPLVARVTFVILVLSTFAAFFVAQRLKSEPPVITVGRITSYISPNGDGLRDGTNVSITIKTADEATVDVVTTDGDRVRRLAEGIPMAANEPRLLHWDGKGDDGRQVRDGTYRVRVTLRDEGRSATVPRTMTVDTHAPRSAAFLDGQTPPYADRCDALAPHRPRERCVTSLATGWRDSGAVDGNPA